MSTKVRKKSDILIVLDLDETLVYATKTRLKHKEDFRIFDYFVYKRPYFEFFIQGLFDRFRIGIWSSGSDDYVGEIVKHIKPDNVNFEMIWGRSRCSVVKNFETQDYFYEKRLDKLKNKGFKLEKILLIDDSPEKTRKNYGNAVYIGEFKGSKSDKELPKLLKYLISLENTENVRILEKRGWYM